jgi:hypothetical protein
MFPKLISLMDQVLGFMDRPRFERCSAPRRFLRAMRRPPNVSPSMMAIGEKPEIGQLVGVWTVV